MFLNSREKIQRGENDRGYLAYCIQAKMKYVLNQPIIFKLYFTLFIKINTNLNSKIMIDVIN